MNEEDDNDDDDGDGDDGDEATMTKIAAPLAGSSRIRMSSQPWLRTMKTTTKNDNDKNEEDDATKKTK